MYDKLLTMMEEAQACAKRLDELSTALAKLEVKRDNCLFKLLGQVRDIVVDHRQLDPPDQRKLLGKNYNVFSSQKKAIDKTLSKVAPDLDAKKRAKYAPVVRFLIAKMPAGASVKIFVRKNGGINGCVAKEKDLRKRGNRKSRKH